LDAGDAGLLIDEIDEGLLLVIADIEEEEGRRAIGNAGCELGRDGAVGKRQRHEERQAETESENDRDRRRAGAMDIGQSIAPDGVPRPRQFASDMDDGGGKPEKDYKAPGKA